MKLEALAYRSLHFTPNENVLLLSSAALNYNHSRNNLFSEGVRLYFYLFTNERVNFPINIFACLLMNVSIIQLVFFAYHLNVEVPEDESYGSNV